MNVSKTNNVGIDVHINRFNNFLNTKLKTLWGMSDAEFMLYGRAYRNQTSDGYTPEVYVGNGEYNDVYWNDSLKSLSFWEVKDTRNVAGASVTAETSLIFMVNVSKIKPSTERNDEQVREDIEKLCLSTIQGFEMIGFSTGVDAVFSEYSGWKKENGMKFRDLHPYHCFKINFKIVFPIFNN